MSHSSHRHALIIYILIQLVASHDGIVVAAVPEGDEQIAVLLVKAQKQAANQHFWADDDIPTEAELERFYNRYEFEIYDLAKAINSVDARGGLVSHTELGVTRNWGQTGKKDIELALAKIPPKTYVGLLRRDGNA